MAIMSCIADQTDIDFPLGPAMVFCLKFVESNDSLISFAESAGTGATRAGRDWTVRKNRYGLAGITADCIRSCLDRACDGASRCLVARCSQ